MRATAVGLILGVAVGCAARESAPREEVPPAAEVVERAAVHPVAGDEVAARYPSLGFYPAVHPTLARGLEAGEPLAILEGLASTFEPYRPPVQTWDRSGYVRIADAPAGFVRRVGEGLVFQDPGNYDLSCAGGFIEGIRLLLVPDLTLDELKRCDPVAVASIRDTPIACDDPGNFGLLALANIARRLPSDRLPGGAVIERRPITHVSTIRGLANPGEVRLCTASHVSRVHQHRFHHHMIAFLEPDEDGRYRFFDTTGKAGVALRARKPKWFVKYLRAFLASSRGYKYDKTTAELNCLTVRL